MSGARLARSGNSALRCNQEENQLENDLEAMRVTREGEDHEPEVDVTITSRTATLSDVEEALMPGELTML